MDANSQWRKSLSSMAQNPLALGALIPTASCSVGCRANRPAEQTEPEAASRGQRVRAPSTRGEDTSESKPR